MNQLDRYLINSVVCNNLFGAKKFARMILENNKSKTNEHFCKEMLKKMEDEAFAEQMLTGNLKNLLIIENPKETFNINRYYLSNREKELADKIIKLDKVSEKLAEVGISYINSTILYGQSGTGKTTFGRYLAHRLDLPFVLLNISKLIDSHLGSTAKNIADVFTVIRQFKCVFMIDEIDAIGMKRGQNHEVGELSRIVIALMQELDRLSGDTILLACTNRLDIIDEALRRRFRNHHEVLNFSEKEQREMVSIFFADIGVPITEEEITKLASFPYTQDGLMKQMINKLIDYYMEQTG